MNNIGFIKRRQGVCPVCDCANSINWYPFFTNFNNRNFKYLKCSKCGVVYVSPMPDKQALSKMYAKHDYHDADYNAEIGGSNYYKSANLLLKNVDKDKFSLLDYGCGLGEFLSSFDKKNIDLFGVEFDKDVVSLLNKTIKTWSVDDFYNVASDKFDVIHIGDVLEHLPDPIGTTNDIVCKLKKGGILYIEGPLENNFSLVYFFSFFYGVIKKLINPNKNQTFPPYHVIRLNEKQQLFLFSCFDFDFDIKYWDVYETGWPYNDGGLVKRIISKISVFLGGKRFFNSVFGNRFHAILLKK